MIEFVLVEIEAADQRADGTVARVQRDKSPLDLRQLGDFPGLFRGLGYADQRTAAQPDVGRGLVAQAGLGGLQALAGDLDDFPVLPHRLDLLGRGFQHHGRHDIAVVRVVGQRVVDGIFGLLGVGGHGDEFLGTAVNLPPLEIHDAFAQRLVGGGLVHRRQRGVDIQAARVGLVAVLAEHQLAHRLGHVLGMHAPVILTLADLEGFFFGGQGLLGGDEPVVLHALDDVQLSGARTLRVADRVVGRRGLGQAGQHGGFGNADVLERLAEIGF